MIYPDDFINQVVCGDFKDVVKELPDESVDCIITDPPYVKSLIYTYEYLAEECPRIMKPGSSLLCIVGHFALEQVMDIFRGKLKYRWIYCMNQFEGPHARMSMGIEILWKPVLHYVKGSFRIGDKTIRGFIKDGVKISPKAGGVKKENHKWEQSPEWASYYIEKLTNPGDTILTPYSGSGSELWAAKQLKRNYIGVEIDPTYVQTSRDRLNTLAI